MVLLEAARRIVREGRPHAGIELVFTPQEEVSLRGAAAFDHTRLHAQTGYVYDQGAPIGEIVLGSPHGRLLDFRFHGRAAHAGMAPEDGRSAIAAAGRAIADFRLGRIDEETSANVGIITGGTARNVVPEWCSFTAEVRSHDERKATELVREMLETAAFAASLAECEVESEVRPSFPGYRFRETDPPVELAADGAAGGGVRADLRALGRRRRRERLQRARPLVREPRERDDGHPHARRAHRRRRPRRDGRGHARARRRRTRVRWIRDASPVALAAVIVGIAVVSNVVAAVALLLDPCDGLARPVGWAVVAAALSGVGVFVVCARVAPHAWIAFAAALAMTVVAAIALVSIVLLQESEFCTA